MRQSRDLYPGAGASSSPQDVREVSWPKTQPRLLLVDDSDDLIEAWSIHFRRRGCSVQTAQSAGEALGIIAGEDFDAVVLDIRLPDQSGLNVLSAIRKISTVPVVMVTGRPSDDLARGAEFLGAQAFLVKPVPLAVLDEELRELMK